MRPTEGCGVQMYVCELPSKSATGGIRMATIGSCRVHIPFSTLKDLGELRICASRPGFTHSVGEARQALETVLGGRAIPVEFNRYIYGADEAPPIDRVQRALAGGVDAFLLEVCVGKQFSFEGVLLQQHFVDRELVRPHRGVLLAWYRRLAAAGEVEKAIVDTALDKLRKAGNADMPLFERLLRGVRLDRTNAHAIERTLLAMMAMAPGRWVVVGALTSPAADGAVMESRRALNADLREACERCGALFFDPSELVEAYGPAMVFADGGANIYEYNPDVYPTVGRAMLERVKAACPARNGPPAPRGAGPLADRINAALVDLHRRRLAEMGSAASGLYAQYQQLLERNLLIGPRDRAALALIGRHMPEYDSYAVMRAGLGEVAFLLAASGRRVVAHETNVNRRSAIEVGLTHLETAGLIEPGMMSVAPELTPTQPVVGRVLGVGLDTSEFRDDGAAAPHLDRAALFTGLLIDPRLFLRPREELAEQDAVLAALADRGLGARREYLADNLTWLRRAR
jgi:hypothetical protein